MGAAVEASGTLAFEPEEPHTGEVFVATGTGFRPGETAILTSEQGWFEPFTVAADDLGAIAAEIEAPARPGTALLNAIGTGTRADGALVGVSSRVGVARTNGSDSSAEESPFILEGRITVQEVEIAQNGSSQPLFRYRGMCLTTEDLSGVGVD